MVSGIRTLRRSAVSRSTVAGGAMLIRDTEQQEITFPVTRGQASVTEENCRDYAQRVYSSRFSCKREDQPLISRKLDSSHVRGRSQIESKARNKLAGNLKDILCYVPSYRFLWGN